MADYKKPKWNPMDSSEYRVLVDRLDSATSREQRVAILKEIAALRSSPESEPSIDEDKLKRQVERINIPEPNVSQGFIEKHEPVVPSEILKDKPAKRGLWQKLKDMFKV